MRDRKNIAHGIDIVFCRLYERFVFSGYDLSFYTAIMSYFCSADVDAFYTKQFDRAALDSFYSRQCQVDSETPLKPLWQEKTFTNQDNWDSFIADKQVLASSVAKLEAYHDWWILEHGKEENDPETQMKELELTTLTKKIQHVVTGSVLIWNSHRHFSPFVVSRNILLNLVSSRKLL